MTDELSALLSKLSIIGAENNNLVQQMLFSYSFKSILDFQTAKDLLKIQQLNKYLYHTFIPNYFATCKERKNNLTKLRIGDMINKEAILLF